MILRVCFYRLSGLLRISCRRTRQPYLYIPNLLSKFPSKGEQEVRWGSGWDQTGRGLGLSYFQQKSEHRKLGTGVFCAEENTSSSEEGRIC